MCKSDTGTMGKSFEKGFQSAHPFPRKNFPKSLPTKALLEASTATQFTGRLSGSNPVTWPAPFWQGPFAFWQPHKIR
jgi:hypothetical protein